MARYKATLSGPEPDPAPPVVEPDKFPLEAHTKPLNWWEKGGLGFAGILAFVGLIWLALNLIPNHVDVHEGEFALVMRNGEIIAHYKEPGRYYFPWRHHSYVVQKNPMVSPGIVFPSEQPKGVCLATHGCNVPETAAASPPPVVVVPKDVPKQGDVVREKSKKNSVTRVRPKNVTKAAPSRRHYQRYRRVWRDDGAWF